MLGGNQYGTFESEYEGRKATESSIPFAYRDVPWEPGAAFRSPGPDPTGHYLMLNVDKPVEGGAGGDAPTYSNTHERTRLSSTGQRLPDTPADGRWEFFRIHLARLPPAPLLCHASMLLARSL